MIVVTVLEITRASGSRNKLRLINSALVQRRQAKHISEGELKTVVRKLEKVANKLEGGGLSADQVLQLAESSSLELRDSLQPDSIKPRKYANLCSLLCAYHIKRNQLESSIAGIKREIDELKALRDRYTV